MFGPTIGSFCANCLARLMWSSRCWPRDLVTRVCRQPSLPQGIWCSSPNSMQTTGSPEPLPGLDDGNDYPAPDRSPTSDRVLEPQPPCLSPSVAPGPDRSDGQDLT